MSYLYLKQKVFSIGESFTFFDVNQTPVYTARGSFLAIPKRYQLFDAQTDAPLMDIHRKLFTFMPRFQVTRPNGEWFCTVRKRFQFFGSKFDIETPQGLFAVVGSVFAHDFSIHNLEGQPIVTVKKHWLAWGDTYEIFFDESQITSEAAASVVLTIDCALHSNRSIFG